MKEIVRQKTFETNSSSTHALIFSKQSLQPNNIPIDSNGNLLVTFGEFDCEELIESQAGKLAYVLTFMYHKTYYWYDAFEDSYEYQDVKKALCEYTGAKDVIILKDIEPYLNHQLYNDSCLIDYNNPDAVINFVFNKDIKLLIDHD